jgi:hypothetical protein
MPDDFKIVDPAQEPLDTLLQVLAVLIDRAGGEVVISRTEFEAFEDVPVVGRLIARDYVRFRLAEEDEEVIIEETEFPEDKPQT